MKKAIYNRIPMAAVVAALFAVGVVGCSENKESSAQTDQCKKDHPKTAQAKQPAVQAARKDVSRVGVKKQQHASVKQTANGDAGKANVATRAKTETMPPADQPNNEKSIEQRRAEAESRIYAVIRVKMEEMIEQRAELLKQGVSASDTRIRDLEGSIMKARELLIEAGEVVEEVDPPIVQRVPRQ